MFRVGVVVWRRSINGKGLGGGRGFGQSQFHTEQVLLGVVYRYRLQARPGDAPIERFQAEWG